MLEKLRALKEEYIISLRPDLDLLEALTSELSFGFEDDSTFEKLRALAHRQAGSAGSFGLTELGNSARQTDEVLFEGMRETTALLPTLNLWRSHLETALR
jgi:HPt (histidine-containing phosphotransfer) domain-containing protein